MDVERFARELPALFGEFPVSEHPRDRTLARVLAEVPGLARENNLALVRLAAGCLEPGECYVEVGSLRGTSLIAAALGTTEEVVGIDDFSMEGASPALLRENLARFGIERATVLEGDVLDLLPAGALGDRRVGVYYYDARHRYDVQLAALRLVEPHLAKRALLVVDDSDWEDVARATRDYLAGQPRARLLLEIPGKSRGFPQWWEGMQALAWEAGP